jgi:hypothetical protein
MTRAGPGNECGPGVAGRSRHGRNRPGGGQADEDVELVSIALQGSEPVGIEGYRYGLEAFRPPLGGLLAKHHERQRLLGAEQGKEVWCLCWRLDGPGFGFVWRPWSGTGPGPMIRMRDMKSGNPGGTSSAPCTLASRGPGRGMGSDEQGRSGGSLGRARDSPDPRVIGLRAAAEGLVKTGLEHEREIHSLARRGPVVPPATRKAGEQHQPASDLRVGWPVYRHRQHGRCVVDIDV